MTENVALWSVRYHRPDYDLYGNEADAARHAVYGEDDGQFSVLGVQFADGRLIKREDWAAYKEARRQRNADNRRRRAEAEAATPAPQREIRDPFEGRLLSVETDEPAWLGRPHDAGVPHPDYRYRETP